MNLRTDEDIASLAQAISRERTMKRVQVRTLLEKLDEVTDEAGLLRSNDCYRLVKQVFADVR